MLAGVECGLDVDVHDDENDFDVGNDAAVGGFCGDEDYDDIDFHDLMGNSVDVWDYIDEGMVYCGGVGA